MALSRAFVNQSQFGLFLPFSEYANGIKWPAHGIIAYSEANRKVHDGMPTAAAVSAPYRRYNVYYAKSAAAYCQQSRSAIK